MFNILRFFFQNKNILGFSNHCNIPLASATARVIYCQSTIYCTIAIQIFNFYFILHCTNMLFL